MADGDYIDWLDTYMLHLEKFYLKYIWILFKKVRHELFTSCDLLADIYVIVHYVMYAHIGDIRNNILISKLFRFNSQHTGATDVDPDSEKYSRRTHLK